MKVILHNIRSIYNVGSIFRTADAVGIEKIYLCGITPQPLDRFGAPLQKFTKVSLGAEKTVQWEFAKRTSTVIDQLKKERYKIVAIEQSKKSMPYYKFKVASHDIKNTVFVLGNEIKGLSPTILKKCDTILEIPMHGKKESLNVAVAFGIVSFHFIGFEPESPRIGGGMKGEVARRRLKIKGRRSRLFSEKPSPDAA